MYFQLSGCPRLDITPLYLGNAEDYVLYFYPLFLFGGTGSASELVVDPWIYNMICEIAVDVGVFAV